MGRVVGDMGDMGPLIDVKVILPASQVEAFKAAGIPYGRPKILRGLIDTGANCSAIDREIAEGLKLASHGFTLIHTPSTGAAYVERLQYGACLIVGEGLADALVLTLPVIESDFSTRAFQLLVGRDVLQSCAFAYDGPTGRFELAWGADRRTPGVIE
jgi:predicted aspartyl protease